MDEEAVGASLAQQLKAVAAAKRTSLGGAFRDFEDFVKKEDKLIGAHLPDVLAHFAPVTALERSFKHRLIQRHKSSQHVAEMLTGGDPAEVRLAMKCRWFFTNVADPAGFVKEVVPNLSAAARAKVVHKYAAGLTSSAPAEQLYLAMKARYGVKAALALLAVCSEDFIRRQLPAIHVPLPPGLALALLNKFPALTVEYLNFLLDDRTPKNKKQKSILESYESVFVELANKDLGAFLLLYDQHSKNVPYMKLGRRVTKRLIKTEMRRVVDNYFRYSRIIVEKTLYSRLSLTDIGRLYDAVLLPATTKEFCQGHHRALVPLQYLRADVRPEVLQSAFQRKYGRNMADEDMLEQMADSWVMYLGDEGRKAWVTKRLLNVEDVSDRAKALALLPSSSSVPQLKALLESQSDAGNRAAIVRRLVATLRINQDAKQIPDLFAYLVSRFRNAVMKFRESIVVEMSKYEDLYLSVTDWTSINAFIDLIKLNREVGNFKYNLRRVFSYQIRQSGDVDSVLRKFLEFELADKGRDFEATALVLCKETPHHRACLEWFSTVQLTWKNDRCREEMALWMFEEISTYNAAHTDHITQPEWVLEFVNKIGNASEPSPSKVDRILTALKDDRAGRHTFVKQLFPRYIDCSILCRLLATDPHLILDHSRQVAEIFGKSFDDYRRFYCKCKFYEEFGLAAAIVRLCRITLGLDEAEFDVDKQSTLVAESSRPHAVRVLALLLPPQIYLELASQYVPKGSKIEKYSDEVSEEFELQRAICGSLVEVRTPLEGLLLLKKFAVGDYLKLATGALVGLGLRVAENKVLNLLESWLDCPASLRKHLIRMICLVAPTDQLVTFLVNVFKKEKNVSLRLVLFNQLRKSFSDEPDESTYETFATVVSQLTSTDEEALTALLDLSTVDCSYIGRYLELLWRLSGDTLPDLRGKILGQMDEHVVRMLSDEFGGVLLTHDLTTSLPTTPPSMFLHYFLLLAPSPEAQSARLDAVLTSLLPAIEAHWDVPVFKSGNVFGIRRVLADIVRTLCEQCERADDVRLSPVQLLTDLKKSLSASLRPEQFLFESVSLDLAVLRSTHNPNLTSPAYLSAVANLFDSYASAHSPALTHHVVQALTSSAPSQTKLELAHLIVQKPSTHPTALVAAIELLDHAVGEGDHEEKYHLIVNKLSTSTEPAVQAAAHKLFSHLTK